LKKTGKVEKNVTKINGLAVNQTLKGGLIMRKIIRGVLALLLIFVGGRYVLLEAVKTFVESSEQQLLVGKEEETEATDKAEEKSTEEAVKKPKQDKKVTPKDVITISGRVKYEVGSKQTAEQMLGDAEIDLTSRDISLSYGVDMSPVNFYMPGVYQIKAKGLSGDGKVEANIVIDVEIFDHTPPVISGQNKIVSYVGLPLSVTTILEELNIVVNDDSAETITPKVDLSSVNLAVPGTYHAKIEAADSSNNQATSFDVMVELLPPPVLRITSKNAKLTYEVGTEVSGEQVVQDAGVGIEYDKVFTMTSNTDVTLLDTGKAGTYDVLIHALDSYGNEESKTISVQMIDTIAPTITGDTYVGYDLAADVSLEQFMKDTHIVVSDNSIERIVPDIDMQAINFAVAGTYVVEVGASDTSGNKASPLTLHVIVGDIIAPEIHANDVVTYENDSVVRTPEQFINDSNLKVSDNSHEPIAPVYDLTRVNYHVPGVYPVEIKATDRAGNTTTKVIEVIIADTIAPILTVNTRSLLYEAGSVLTTEQLITDAQIKATDNSEEVIRPRIDMRQVDTNRAGNYEVIVTASDSSGNTSHIVLEVVMKTYWGIDMKFTSLVRSISDEPLSVEAFLQLSGFVARDINDKLVNPKVDLSSVNWNEGGVYTAVVVVGDEKTGNIELQEVPIIIQYPQPTINIELGANELTYELGRFVSPDQIIRDAGLRVGFDFRFKTNIHYLSGQVDNTKIGDYVMSYLVESNTGQSEQIDIVIHMIDTFAPTINIGKSEQTYEVGTTKTPAEVLADANVTVIDDSGEMLTPEIELSGVNFNKIGTYEAPVAAIDSSNNIANGIIKINIVDRTPPEITLKNPTLSYDLGAKKTNADIATDAGISATDNSGEVIAPQVDISHVDFNKPGKYEADVIATDSSRNTAMTTITINIVDKTPPVLQILNKQMTYPVGTAKTSAEVVQDAGITATDDSGETITPEVDLTNVNFNKPGSYEADVTASDSSGNKTIDKITIVVEDKEPPTINVSNETITTEVGKNKTGEELLSEMGVTINDNSGETITPNIDISKIDFNRIGDYEAEITATDSSGNTATKKVPVHVGDTTPPVLEIKEPEKGYALGTTKTAEEVITDTGISATDNSGEVISPEVDLSGVDWRKPGKYEVPVKATDSSGNEATGNVTIDIIDTTPPVLNIEHDNPLYPIGTPKTSAEIVQDTNITATDDSGEVITPEVDLSGVDWNKPGSYEVDVKATDSSGNTVTKKMTIVLQDSVPPTINTTKDELTSEVGTSKTAEELLQDLGVTITDNSGETITPELDMSGVDFNKIGDYEVEVKATDSSGNTATKKIPLHVTDTTPPVLDIKESEKTYVGGTQKTAEDIINEVGITATDNSGEVITPEVDLSTVDWNKPGKYEAQVKATDSSGNTSTGKVMIEIIDTTPPVLNVPSDNIRYPIGIPKTSEQIVQEVGITATDDSGEVITPEVDVTGVDWNKPGNYEVEVKATDSSGNTAMKKINITVFDNEPPSIDATKDELTSEVGTPKTAEELLEELGVTITDNSGETITPEVDASGVDFNKIGDYEIEVKATDSSGNTSTKKIPVHIVDTTPPVLEIKEAEKSYLVGTQKTAEDIINEAGISATDNSGEAINPEIDMNGVDWHKPGKYEAEVKATDSSGNTSTGKVTIEIIDTTPPVLNIPSDNVRYPIGTPKTSEQVVQEVGITATDDSGEVITPEVDLTGVDWNKPGDYEVEVKATDSSGNTVTNKMTITVFDSEPPTIDTTKDDLTLEVGTPKTAEELLEELGTKITDNSGETITPELDMRGVDFNKIGDYEIEVKATDSSGNTSTKKIPVHVVDTTPPVLEIKEREKGYLIGTKKTAEDILREAGVSATDNSGEVITPEVDLSNVDFDKPGKYEAEVKATDSSGNTAIDKVTIEIIDTTPPVLKLPDTSLQYPIGIPKTSSEVIKDADITATDDSGETITPEVDLSGVDWHKPGSYEAEVTATDSSGNVTTGKITIEVFDNVPPVIDATHDALTVEAGTPKTNSGETITPELDLTGVDWNKPGDYEVEVKATDNGGNETTKKITIHVVDTTPPDISADETKEFPLGIPLTNEEIIDGFHINVFDNTGEAITPEIDMSKVDVNKPGKYPIEITATDSAGNKSTKTVEAEIKDLFPPTVEIKKNEVEYPLGTPKTPEEILHDAGVEVSDNSGETITPEVDMSGVDFNKPGSYEVEVKATDSAGNTTVGKVTIKVLDTTPPVLNITNGEQTYEVGKQKTPAEILADAGVTVTDDSGEEIKPEVDMSGVDFNKPGDYEAEVKATDSSGNSVTGKITIHVVDTTPPVITGEKGKSFPKGKTLTEEQLLKELNIKVTDNSGEEIKPEIDMSKVDFNKPGKYPVEIKATDSAGNMITKTVEITIVDDDKGDDEGSKGNGNDNGGTNGGRGGMSGMDATDGYGAGLPGTGDDHIMYQYIIAAMLIILSVILYLNRKKVALSKLIVYSKNKIVTRKK